MRQYCVYFLDKTMEYVIAYSHKLENHRATFDTGRNHDYVLMNVDYVTVCND